MACALAGLILLAVLGLFTTPDPRGHSTHEQLGLPPCMMMKYLGVPCPGCGVTTAMSCFAHGDWVAAVQVQPFGALLALLFVLVAVLALVDTVRGIDAWAAFRRRARPWTYWCLGAVMLAAWVWKIVALRG